MNYQKKNIAIAIPSLAMGGAERVASELANEFVNCSMNVTFILLDKNEVFYQLNENIKVYFNSYNKNQNSLFRNKERIKNFRKFIMENSIDVVISFLTSANILSILATKGTNAKVYISERSDPNTINKKVKFAIDFLYRFCDGAFFQTEDAKKCFSKKIQKKSSVIGNPIKNNLPKWKDVKVHDESIVTAVRLEKSKNIPMLLDAFLKVQEVYPNYKLIIFGDGPEYENIKEKSKLLGLEKNVILKGRDNKWHEEAIYSSIFVLSSDYEGMSNSLLEALAMGMPVVSTDHPIGGAREVIKNGKNGFLVPVNNAEAFSNKLLELISNKEMQDCFSKEAEKIRLTMNVQKIAKSWLDYILGETKI